MAEERALRERLAELRTAIRRDATELRGRWEAWRGRVRRDWREVGRSGREVVDVLALVLRRLGRDGS
ncbi:MAG: hypothetical protein QN122_07025 [Armatimonadota bacterium]|nr:hypothetical protein [Armatimonadota bacterium]MDR7449070.1 hypothetical protein [Armatimonadota bacterium]MDR7459150.1 hypothetical protein [Armatimonadota bacterium]MDR7480422.1 hypothetical protein [Armatimonadota bacterium]MDR7489369.1 hypothetical protein [Armatimonadota bacterium]